MTIPNAPAGFSTVNPFLVTRDVDGLIAFLTEVFGAIPHPTARTMDTDGLVLHDELQVGGTTLMFAERKPDWPFTPALLQIYVDDVEATLARAEKLGAEIVTRPTDFFGDVFSRFLDPWQNLWWVYSTSVTADDPQPEEWGEDDQWSGEGDWEPSPEMTYIRDTVVSAFPRIKDPHAS